MTNLGFKVFRLENKDTNCYVAGEYEIKSTQEGYVLILNNQDPRTFKKYEDLLKYLKDHPAW